VLEIFSPCIKSSIFFAFPLLFSPGSIIGAEECSTIREAGTVGLVGYRPPNNSIPNPVLSVVNPVLSASILLLDIPSGMVYLFQVRGFLGYIFSRLH
jgi:hypothetical protein